MKGKCEVCGEPYDTDDPRPSVAHLGEFVTADDLRNAEMGYLDENDIKTYIAHAECGLQKGMVTA